MARFEVHSHSEYSNIRLLDSINKVKRLIDRAIDLGLSGIALTDHECLCGHVEANQYAKKIKNEHPDFKVVLGNEIYLIDAREKGRKYYHFILIAKNKTGYRALKELSSKAWMQSYFDRGLERVPTLYTELEEIVNKYPNSLIATTACLGGQLGTQTLRLIKAEKLGDTESAEAAHQNIVTFILWCKKLFGNDFYLEVAPAKSKEQIAVNQRMENISKCFNVPIVIGTDAHYLSKEDRYVHKAYLNSKDGDREVDDFYQYSYLQTKEEIIENLAPSGLNYETLEANSMEIYDKIEFFDLFHSQVIPSVDVKDYPKMYMSAVAGYKDKYPTLSKLYESDDIYDRYWINECIASLSEKKNVAPWDDKYMDRLEEEARVKSVIGEKLGTNMFKYPITLQHYVDLFWECGSIVGAGRGSSCSGLNHYLLGITQLDPLQWDLPFWRLRL